MVISSESKKQLGKFLRVNSKEHVANIYANQLQFDDFTESEEIEVLTQIAEPSVRKTAQGGMVIASPGEFEKDGMFIFTADTTGNERIDMVEVEAEGIRVLYYAASEEINRDVLNQIGVIDILVLQIGPEYAKQIKTVSIIDPQVLIPVFTEGVDVEKFKADVGVKFEETNKYKCKSTDFALEEYVLHGVLLTA